MSDGREEITFRPKSVLIREVGYENHLAIQQGVLDFDQSADYEFLKYKLTDKLIKNNRIAIRTGRLKTPKDFTIVEDAIDKIDRIWNGICYRGIFRKEDEFSRVLFFESPLDKIKRFKSTGDVFNKKISS